MKQRYFTFIIIILLLFWISFIPTPIQWGQILFVNVFLILAFSFLVDNQPAIFKAEDFPLWIFIVAIGFNVFVAEQKTVSFKTYLNLAIPMISLYYLIPYAIFSKDKLNLLARIICVVSILIALGGLFDSLFRNNFIYEYFIHNPYYERYKSEGFVRAMSTQYNSVPLGSFLIASLPFNFISAKQPNYFKWLGILGVILSLFTIVLTLSRGVVISSAVMLLFIFWANKKYRLILILAVVLCTFVIAGSYFNYPFNKLGFKGFFTYRDSVFSPYRSERLIMVQRIIKDHPFFGLGFMHFRIRFYEYCSGKGTEFWEFTTPDNMYLAILAETGIIGFAGFLFFIYSIILKALRQFRKLKNNPENRQKFIFIFAGLLGLLVHLAAYELFYWPGQYIYFCILIGLIEAFHRNSQGYEN
jgi:O-antigen ligase